jgi:hypothetical protein
VTKYAYFPRCGVADADLSENTIFEGPDPKYWCPNGYSIINVDSRGAWNSEGDLTFMTEQEGQGWLRPHRMGRRAALVQRKTGPGRGVVSGLVPMADCFDQSPHLAAINPWEGVSDFYRELGYHEVYRDLVPGLKGFMSFTRLEWMTSPGCRADSSMGIGRART